MNLEELLKMKKKYEQDFIFNEDYDDTHYLDAFIEKYGETLYEAMKELEKYLTRDAVMKPEVEIMLNELAKEVHQNAVAHGWWEEERSFGEIIALCHSELSEALEEYRNDKPIIYFECNFHDTRAACPDKYDGCQCGLNLGCNQRKPEGIAIELADCIIRILDYCGYVGIDIEEAIKVKHEYNKTRPYKHGGKVI